MSPVQVYGETKLSGEQAVREAGEDVVIVRLSFIYGIHRSTDALTGFPEWVRDRVEEGEETPLFTDQHVTPSRAGAAAETPCDFVERDARGTYHVAARLCVTPYEFGEAIAERMEADSNLLAAGSQSDIDHLAMRPSYTCLDVTRVEEELGRPEPTLEHNLDAIQDAFELRE